MPIMVTLLYIGLSIAFHVWSLHVRWYDPMSYWWTDGLLALFVSQRFSKQNNKPFRKPCRAETDAQNLRLAYTVSEGRVVFYNLALTEENMLNNFDLKLSVYSLGLDICLLSFKFNSGLMGWPPQPPRERECKKSIK